MAVASLLAEAAAEGAAENVRVNLPSLGDDPWVAEVERRLEGLLDELQALAESCRSTVTSSVMREPVGLIAAP